MMKKQLLTAAIALGTFILSIVWSVAIQAQTPTEQPSPAAPSPLENAVPIAPLPNSATEYKPPSPSPSSTAPQFTPPPSPGATPSIPGASPTPGLPPVGIPGIPLAPPIAPLPAADPLPTAGEFSDPSKPFRIAILKDYQVTTIGNAVMLESPDGNLAYTALAQQAPSGFATPDILGEIAKATFKQGEGFQPGTVQAIPGGMRMDWNGSLTIGGNPQPVNGLIVAKPTGANVLVLLIVATEAGAEKIPNAAAALVDSFQAV
jgi:hypothetical protein